MFDKKILTEEFVITHKVSSILPVNNDELLNKYILPFYYSKKRVNDDPFYQGYHYTKIDYHKTIQWIQDYIRDHYNEKYRKCPVATQIAALVQGPGDIIGNHHHIDDWNYEGSPDISALYCVEGGGKSSDIMFEYECGRDKKRRWRIAMETGRLVIFSSSLLHSLTRNKNKDPIVNLSFQFQLI